MGILINSFDTYPGTPTSTLPVVESWTFGSSGNETLTINKPTGVQTNDLLIIAVGNDKLNPSDPLEYNDTTNKPTGFTLIGCEDSVTQDITIAAFYRIADGTEGSSFSVSAVTASEDNETMGWCYRISGVDTTTPIGDWQIAFGNTGDQSYIRDGGALVLAAHFFDGGDGHPHTVSGTGWSLGESNQQSTSNISISGAWATNESESVGFTTSPVFSGQVSDGSMTMVMTIVPSAVDGTIYNNYIMNKTLDDSSNVILDSAWSVANGVATYDKSASNAIEFSFIRNLPDGSDYDITFDMASVGTQGNFKIELTTPSSGGYEVKEWGAVTEQVGLNYTGTYTLGTDSDGLLITGTTASPDNFDIDNVVMKIR